jgi:hypothetical protein
MYSLQDVDQSASIWIGAQEGAGHAPREAGIDGELLGRRVRCSEPLPFLPRWSGAADTPPDLFIEFGDIAAEALRRSWSPAVSIGDEGSVLFNIPGLGKFLMIDDRRVVIDCDASGRLADVHRAAHDLLLPLLCLRWGLVPLRGTAVALGEEAMLFAGQPAAGKSTLAAAAMSRGARLIGDGIVVGRPDAALVPGVPRLSLWQDSRSMLGLSGPLADASIDANWLPVVPHALAARPLRLNRLMLVAVTGSHQVASAYRIPASHALRPGMLIPGWRLARALGFDRAIFRGLSILVAGSRAARLARGRDPQPLGELLDLALAATEAA